MDRAPCSPDHADLGMVEGPIARGPPDPFLSSEATATTTPWPRQFNSLFKAELVRNKAPWKSIVDLEIAVAEYIDWLHHRRLHGEIGLVPPVEFDNDYYRHNPAPTTVSASFQSLY